MDRPQAAFVIMAGGRGERLWPVVRNRMPKVCVRVDGKQTLLETTLNRLQGLARPRHILIVTTKEQARPIRKGLPRAIRPSLLVEPEPKNTAACIALAAATLATRDPGLVMVALPADHWITQTAAFQRSLRAAIAVAADSGRIVTIGVRPTRVHPGLGHLCVGSSVGRRGGCRVFRLARFVEKPSSALAQQLMRQHRTYWNAGIFAARVTTFLELIQRWLPTHASRLFALGDRMVRRSRAAYRGLQAVSFDDGVMAHLHEGYVVEGNFQWEDLGSWESWARIKRLTPPHLAIASRNVRVLSSDRHLVATVGLQDVIVVQTADATLVCQAHDTQAVRRVAARLSQDKRLARYA